MDDPILTIDERAAINAGRWFSTLSPSLRHDILRCAYVKRFKDGDLIAARGDPPEEWIACARGAVRVSSTSISGKQITLAVVAPDAGTRARLRSEVAALRSQFEQAGLDLASLGITAPPASIQPAQ